MAKALILKQLIDSLGLSVYAFEQEIGAVSTVQKAFLRANSEITPRLIQKIVLRFPEVNQEWLLTGKGEMFLKNTVNNAYRTGNNIGAIPNTSAEAPTLAALKLQLDEIRSNSEMLEDAMQMISAQNVTLTKLVEWMFSELTGRKLSEISTISNNIYDDVLKASAAKGTNIPSKIGN